MPKISYVKAFPAWGWVVGSGKSDECIKSETGRGGTTEQAASPEETSSSLEEMS